MPISHGLLRAVAVSVALLVPVVSRAAQGTAVVHASDPAYADIDRLHALGLLDSVIIGQRPYSHREFARLTGIARDRSAIASPDRREQAIVLATLARLEHRLGLRPAAPRPRVGLVDDLALVALGSTASRRPILGDIGQFVEATIDPLARRRLGAPAPRGQTLSLEMAHRAEPAGWLSLQARERIEGSRLAGDSGTRTTGELLGASARVRHRNLAVSVGREQFTWAQRAGDGFFLASDAPALDQLSLASDRPFVLPGFLRRAGLVAGTLIVADLGASVVRSHSRLLAYKVSIVPAPALELGATFQNHFGGEGARPTSPGNRLIDFLPFIDIFRKHNYTDTTRTLDVESDKVIGADMRLTLHRLGGLVIAGEWLVDDFDATRPMALFTNDASQSLAILVPRLGSPALSLELSAKHMGIYTSTHTPLTNGMSTRGRLLGDELGPDAKAFGARLRWEPLPGSVLSLDGRSAVHSDVTYFASYLPDRDNVWAVFKVSSLPNELRERMVIDLLHHPPGRLALHLRAGAERIRNARFFGDRTSYVAEVGVRVQP